MNRWQVAPTLALPRSRVREKGGGCADEVIR